MILPNITRYYQIENMLKQVKDVYNHVKINKDIDTVLANDIDTVLANDIINGLLNEVHKEFYYMVEQSKSTKDIINYKNCLITLLTASSIDLCEAIINNSDDTIINDFYDRWNVLYNKTSFL